MNISPNIINLEALLYALAQQSESLPEALQKSLQDTGRSLRSDQPEAARQLRELIRQYSPLESGYIDALTQWDAQYAAQERTKSLSATFKNVTDLDQLFIQNVMPTADWVSAAKQLAHSAKAQTKPESLWDKTDRIAVMIAGGAALGGAVAQLPGVVIGVSLAGIYGWYISFAKPKSVKNS